MVRTSGSEASTIAAFGSALGYLVYAGILAAVALIVRRQTGVVIDVFTFHPALVFAPALMVAMGAIAGLLAQGMEPWQAAGAGAWLHGRAAALHGPGLLAEDLATELPLALAEARKGAL